MRGNASSAERDSLLPLAEEELRVVTRKSRNVGE
jgi:hypothetical protein